MNRLDARAMRKKLVLVDDEQDIREILRQSLELKKDWEVLEASDGEKGLALIRNEHPDAVLLDVMMPHKSGRDVFQSLRSDPMTSEIPVIFLTASIQRQEIRELESLGPKAVLRKPFDPLTIADEVAQILDWE